MKTEFFTEEQVKHPAIFLDTYLENPTTFYRMRMKKEVDNIVERLASDEALVRFIMECCNGNFHDFRKAVDAIKFLNYKRLGISTEVYFSMKTYIRNYARQVVDHEWVSLFDEIVDKSKEELWNGDQFFELFGTEDSPHYVRSCTLSALRIYCILKSGRNDIEVFKAFSQSYYHPEYWDLFEECDIFSPELQKPTAEFWDEIAEKIWNGDFLSEMKFMSAEGGRYSKEYFFKE